MRTVVAVDEKKVGPVGILGSIKRVSSLPKIEETGVSKAFEISAWKGDWDKWDDWDKWQDSHHK